MSSDTLSESFRDMKPVEIVYDEERIKILIDETRKSILGVLSEAENDLSVTEIADKLRTNPQRIYHHVDKLVDYNFIKKTREERKRRSITSYYARTAKAFIVSYSTDRGFIHDNELIDHFVDSFRTILNLKLDNDEKAILGDYITELASISEKVFMRISNRSDHNIQRHNIENLYFLLEYLIFYTNPEARNVLNKFTEFVLPKIEENSDQVKSLKI